MVIKTSDGKNVDRWQSKPVSGYHWYSIQDQSSPKNKPQTIGLGLIYKQSKSGSTRDRQKVPNKWALFPINLPDFRANFHHWAFSSPQTAKSNKKQHLPRHWHLSYPWRKRIDLWNWQWQYFGYSDLSSLSNRRKNRLNLYSIALFEDCIWWWSLL